MGAQLGMQNSSCLSYLNPASNRTVIVQETTREIVNEESRLLQLISITVMKLSLLSDI